MSFISTLRLPSTTVCPDLSREIFNMPACTLCAMFAAAAVYASVCLLFIFFPELIHKKKKLGFSVQLTAHRGGAGEHIENTMAAFRWAAEKCDADMLELDVHLTKDGQVVVAHDKSLLRTAGVDANVEDFDYSELPLLNQHIPLQFADAKCEKICEDRRIPLLREVMEAFPNVAMNIDLKRASDELISKTAALIHEFKRERNTFWGSVSQDVYFRCRARDSSIPMYFSARDVFLTPLLFWTGLLAFLPIRPNIYETALPVIYLEPQMPKSWLVENFGVLISAFMEKYMLSPVFISYLRRRGIPTVVWVLNSDQHFEHAYRIGAVGIHTDYPSKLRKFISSNPSLCRSQVY